MTVRRTARPLAFTAVVLSLGGPAVALGQEVGPYDPLGIRAGSFLIYPSLGVSEVYDDNVFAVKNNKDDDLITVVEPGIRAESNFSRHSLGLTAGSEVAFHVNEEDEDYQDFFVEGDGRLDITRQNFVDAALRFARDHRDRDDPEDAGDRDQITDLNNYGGELSFTQLFNRLNFRVPASQPNRLHRDGGGGRGRQRIQRAAAHRLLRLAAHQHLHRGALQRRATRPQ